jgi:hypothetical protein
MEDFAVLDGALQRFLGGDGHGGKSPLSIKRWAAR